MRIARELLQERIANERTRLWGDESVFIIEGGKVIQNTKLKNINNERYTDDLNKLASKVIYRKEARTFMIYL